MEQRELRTLLPPWAEVFDEPAAFIVVKGGRGAAKSWTVAHMAVMKAVQLEVKGEPWQIACVREYMTSMDQSVKPLLEGTMARLGVADFFTFRASGRLGPGIYGRHTGGRIFFSGMSTTSEEAIKGWESVSFVWYDEAHRLSTRSWELLVPTIRQDGSTIWLTYNPQSRNDVAYLEFCGKKPRRTENVIVKHVTYEDNYFFTQRNEEERLHCLQVMPERYAHVWLGEPDDAGDEFRLLPYATLAAIANTDTWALRPQDGGRANAGYDVAAQGDDSSALVLRTGPAIQFFAEQRKQKMSKVMEWVDDACLEHEVAQMYYDVTGVGEAVRAQYEIYQSWENRSAVVTVHEPGKEAKDYFDSDAARAVIENAQRRPKKPPYGVIPEQFGGAVTQPERRVVMGIKNKDFFERRNAQMGWELRRRARNTVRLLDGEDVDPHDCLFIDPNLPGLDQFLTELSQPVWEEQSTGKVRLIKAPDGAPSPNYFDAACLAFAGETRSMGWRPA